MLLALIHIGTNTLNHCFRSRTQIEQDFDEQTVVVRKDVKDVSRFDRLPSPRAGAFHCSFEQVGSIGSNAKSLSDMLASVVQTLIDSSGNENGIESQTTDGRVKEIGFLFRQATDDVFDSDVILISPP